MVDIIKYNADWLQAWTDKDVERLLTFYSEDVLYKDQQTPAGITGHAALGAYLKGLFAATPPMEYKPETTYAIEGGFCGRWFCDLGPAGVMRGFDFTQLRGDKIIVNEVYTHMIPKT